MSAAYELKHFSTVPGPYDGDGWKYLEHGHDRFDSRGTGGAWYYRGDREAAAAQLTEYKKETAARQAAYYAQPWL